MISSSLPLASTRATRVTAPRPTVQVYRLSRIGRSCSKFAKNSSTMSGPRMVYCQAGRNSMPLAQVALEKLVSTINRLLFDYEQKQRRIRALSNGGGPPGSVAPPLEPPQPGKPLSFGASASGEKLVKEPAPPSVPTIEDAATRSDQQPAVKSSWWDRARGVMPAPAISRAGSTGRSLREYLALPLEQYSLLDPKWITRDSDRPDRFHLKVPLMALVGLDLNPQLSITAKIDEAAGKVEFTADSFKVGEPNFDRSNFQLEMRATLRHKPVMEAFVSRLPSLWGRQQTPVKATPAGWPGVPAASSPATPAAGEAAAKGPEEAEQEAALALGVAALLDDAGPSSRRDIDTSSAAATSSASPVQAALGSSGCLPLDYDISVHEPATAARQQTVTATMPAATESANTLTELASCSASASNGAADVSSNGTAAMLCCSVNVSLGLTIPYPLSIVPGPLLSTTAALVAKMAMQRLLPSFLDLLAVDYSRWAAGTTETGRSLPAGSLVSEVPMEASSEAGTAHLGVHQSD